MPDIQQIIPLFILIPLLGVFLLALFARKKNFYADLILFFIVSGLLLLSGCLFVFKTKALIHVYCLAGWHLPEAITFIVDGLADFFLVSVYLMTFCIMLYCLRFIDHWTSKWKFYALFLLLLTGANGVIISGDLFTLYLFMEVTAIASYALICFSLEKKALAFGFKYMIKGIMASAIIFLGIIICYCFTSTLALADIANQLYLRQHIAADPAMGWVVLFIQALLFIGFLIKSGIVPFNSWVSEMNQSILAPVGAMLLAIIIPVLGIYPFLRIHFNIIGPSPESLAIVRIFAMAAMLGSLFWAFKPKNSNQAIAYYTISEFGLVILAMATNTPWAIYGGFLQLLHIQITAALVTCNAGLLDYRIYPKKSLDQLTFSFKSSPKAFIMTMLSNAAFISLPPFIGFWSKLIIIVAVWKANYHLYAIGVLLIVCFAAGLFIKNQKKLPVKNSDFQSDFKLNKIKFSMAGALLLMLGLCLGLNLLLATEYKETFLNPAIDTILSTTKYSKAVFKAENEK
ncbi:MAG: hypothetical protein KJ915_03890 [Candidatus Omnitrophica bacterium]|nr:hypothetical protein [Candidatus Omnitrophota bacterium]